MKEDTTKHQERRHQLIQVLKDKGITDKAVLKAIGDIPRHLFMDSSFEDHAYKDKAFPIGADQTISHPYTVAFQSQQLMVKPGVKVLEIGTGSGYQTAVLCHMGAVVYSIERQHELFRTSLKRLPALGFKTKKLIFGDGYKGYSYKAPFDRIIVTWIKVIPRLFHWINIQNEMRMISMSKRKDCLLIYSMSLLIRL